MDKVREFISDVLNMAKERGLNCFVVSDGASGYTNNGSEAVRHARECHIRWEQEHGYDPYEDWGSKVKKYTGKRKVSESCTLESTMDILSAYF